MKHTINGAEYERTPEGAVFRDGIQVVIPAEGADVLADLVELTLGHQRETDADLLEEYEAAKASADPDAVAVLDPPERVLHWKGFDVKETVEDGVDLVSVTHEDRFAIGAGVLSFSDEDEARRCVASLDDPYTRLTAMAALAWFRHFQPQWRTWKPGDVLTNEVGGKAFISVTSEGERILITANGTILPLQEDLEEKLRDWWLA